MQACSPSHHYQWKGIPLLLRAVRPTLRAKEEEQEMKEKTNKQIQLLLYSSFWHFGQM
jgi:hypothetical protein